MYRELPLRRVYLGNTNFKLNLPSAVALQECTKQIKLSIHHRARFVWLLCGLRNDISAQGSAQKLRTVGEKNVEILDMYSKFTILIFLKQPNRNIIKVI